ncbi:MAG: hypothetical protein ABSD81_01165 [Methanomicrobiales archaeon]|jgi:hypothetical protein
MKALVRYGSVGVLILVAFIAIARIAPLPVVFTPENVTYPREGQLNIEFMKEKVLSSDATLYPVMQDLLDYTGPIMVSIRSDNFDEARQDIMDYVRRQGDLQHLIINLDMNETEIRDFLDSQERQAVILRELANTTSYFNDLSSLEVRYREENQSGALVSISYQGESLRERIHTLQERYLNESRAVTSISARQGLENSTYDESVAELAGIVGDIDRTQGMRAQELATSLTPSNRSALTLILDPDTGRYLDEIRIFGSLSGEGGPVTLTLDNRSVAELATDGRGAFSTLFTVELVPAGNHSMGAESPGIMAEPRILVVEPVDSTINLTVEAVKNTSNVICRGYLTANRPVRRAPVDLLWEGHDSIATATDASGFFRTVLRLPAGTHRLAAQFANATYPINPSVSATYEVTSTGEGIPSVREAAGARYANGTPVSPGEPPGGLADLVVGAVARVLPIAFILLMAAVAALGYLRKGVRGGPVPVPRPSPSSPPGEAPGGSPVPSMDLFLEVPLPLPMDEPLRALYLRTLREFGLSGAAHRVYRRFAGIIGMHAGIGNPSLLTPREMARACTDRTYGKIFDRFVRCYERIRYAGLKNERARGGFEDSMEKTRAVLEGDGR